MAMLTGTPELCKLALMLPPHPAMAMAVRMAIVATRSCARTWNLLNVKVGTRFWAAGFDAEVRGKMYFLRGNFVA